MKFIHLMPLSIFSILVVFAGCTQSTDTVEPLDTTQNDQPSVIEEVSGFHQTFKSYSDSPLIGNELPEGSVQIATAAVDDCPPNPDGPCGYNLFVYGSPDWVWDADEVQVYYIGRSGGADVEMFFGPFEDNLINLGDDLNSINNISKVRTF